MKLKRAFSLIELSIVTLVIGILIAGIIQGKSLYVKMKLAAARSLTQSSPANGVPDLVLWLETTSEASFPTSLDDQSPVSTWNDINPQQTNKSDATASAIAPDDYRPLYVANGINGLPALKCDGVDDLISVPSGTNYYPTGAPSITNNFTIFLVAYPDPVTHEIDTQTNSTGNKQGTAGQKYILGPQNGADLYGGTEIVGVGISLGTNGVSVYENGPSYLAPLAVYSGSNGLSGPVIITINYKNKTPTIFINGTSVQVGLTSLKTSVFPPVKFCSGVFGAFSGKIGEIIIYGKLVPAADRAQIEKYLGKKWGIKVA